MPPIRGEVSFFAVSFGYNPDQLVLKESSGEAGQMIALVGPYRCWQKHYHQLILRFYDVTDGAVKLMFAA